MAITTVTQTIPPKAKDINLTVPELGRFVQIKPDYEIFGVPRQLRDGSAPDYGFPAVVNRQKDAWGFLTTYDNVAYDYVDMPDRWQWFLWDMWNHFSSYLLPTGKITRLYTKDSNTGTFAETPAGSLFWVYVNMIEKSRSHTDARNAENGARDVVTGRNLGSNFPYQWLASPNTGQLGMIKRDMGSKWELHAIDLLQPVPSMDELESMPYLWGWATESKKEKLPDGRYVVTDYAHIDQALKTNFLNSPRTGTPIPFLSLGGSVLIDKKACRPLENGQPWSPYVPAQ
jgi:hypothetical protein